MADIGSFGSMGDAKNPWIGTIPAGWGVGRAGFYYDIQLGKMLCSTPSSNAYTLEKYFCAANVHYEDADSRGLKEMWFSPSEKPAYEVSEGDMLVVEGGAGAGGCAIVKKLDAPAYMQNSILRVRGRGGASNVYFCYWLEYLGRSGYIDIACNKATIPHFTKEKLSAVPLPLPPVAEQQRIVSFLDRECEKIDALKTKIETQIAKLEELRKCMISEVVTNGLKYKGKRNCCQAEVGSLPPGWSVNRLKYLADIQTGPFGTQLSASEYVDEGVPCINVKNIGDGVVKIDNIDKVPASVLERLPAHVLKTGDLVFGRKGSVDRHAVIRETNNGWLQGSDCIRVRIKGMDTDFASFYLRSNVVSDFLLKLAKGSTMPSMNAETIGIICMRIPPIEEQHKIAAYLKGKCAAVDIAICNFSNQLDKLSEYRKSLIYEYVTGKKEVA